ncbi:MAG: hypothetical protein HC828_18100 [Blastochloris sp.]|nr:hypothetical protein [Blastochloris sp.]
MRKPTVVKILSCYYGLLSLCFFAFGMVNPLRKLLYSPANSTAVAVLGLLVAYLVLGICCFLLMIGCWRQSSVAHGLAITFQIFITLTFLYVLSLDVYLVAAVCLVNAVVLWLLLAPTTRAAFP